MEKIIMDDIPKLDFRVEEAYKTLRTNIQFCGEDVKTVSFTSCIPNEGKSVVSIQLSKTMAELGKKVLFIDADIRGSVMGERYNIQGSVKDVDPDSLEETEDASRYSRSRAKQIQGLSEYITGQCSLEECIYSSNVEGMDLMLTGRSAPNPSELLGSSKFKKMLHTVREKYDYIFIDTPPLGAIIDAAIIASICDGVIMVIESDKISYKFAQNVKKQLESSGCKILGAVLNKVELGKGGYYYNNYKKYYNNYYEKGKKK